MQVDIESSNIPAMTRIGRAGNRNESGAVLEKGREKDQNTFV
jgi:hypothetical protein